MSKAILNNIDLQTISDIFTGKYTKNGYYWSLAIICTPEYV